MPRKKWPEVTITITLSPDEVQYLSQNCIGRVATSAQKAVPNDYEYWDDLEELKTLVEPLRYRMAGEIFKARLEMEKKDQDNFTFHKFGG